MIDRIPYTYFIAWQTLGAWYYGVRYAKGCNPSDLFNTYKTSSKVVKEFIVTHGDPDIIQIRKTFNDPVSAKNYEDKVLRRMRVGLIPNCLNIKSDSFRNLDTSKINYPKGENNPIHTVLSTIEGRKTFSISVSEGTKIGIANSEKYKAAAILNKERMLSDLNPGKNKSKETIEKISISQKIRFSDNENKKFGHENPFYGKTHSDTTKEIISVAAKRVRESELFICSLCQRTIKSTANFQKHLRLTHYLPEEQIKTLSKNCRQQVFLDQSIAIV